MEEMGFYIRNSLWKNGMLQMKANLFQVLLLTSDFTYTNWPLPNLKHHKKVWDKRVELEDASLTEDKVGCDLKAY